MSWIIGRLATWHNEEPADSKNSHCSRRRTPSDWAGWPSPRGQEVAATARRQACLAAVPMKTNRRLCEVSTDDAVITVFRRTMILSPTKALCLLRRRRRQRRCIRASQRKVTTPPDPRSTPPPPLGRALGQCRGTSPFFINHATY